MYKILTDSNEWVCSDWKAHFVRPLKKKWDDIHDKTDVFNYKIGPLLEKTTDSKYLLQLNPNRFSKRRPPEFINEVCQKFSKNSFNFTRITNEEEIFHMVNSELDSQDENNRHTLVVNVSPVNRYHSLLCPSLKQCLPQMVTESSLKLVLNIMQSTKERDLRIGFNSLCGLASVNHLHYHLFWLPNELLVESALNPNIFLKCRPPEYIEQVRQHFSKNSFNFTKAAKEEIILHMVNADLDTHDEYNRHTLLVSVSPIIKYHTLLCPLLKQCRPQVATEDSINLILNIMKLAKDRDLRIGFNSLCALAAVNHLHYHLFWLPNELPVESAQCTQVKGELYRFENYRAPAFCFQVDDKSDNIHKDIYKLIRYFLEKSIAHNMVVTRGREIKDEESRKEVIRVVIWPRKSCGGVKQLTTFSVAVCELSGWFPISDVSSFNTLTENDIIFELDKWKMDNFDSLCAQVETFF